MDHSTLAKFGAVFQSKVISSLVSDGSFLSITHDIVEIDFFENQANKWIVNVIKEYFPKYGVPPTLEVFKIKISQIDNEVLKKTVIDNLRNAWKGISATDLDYVKEEFLTFCKEQRLKTAIMRSVDLLQLGEYEAIQAEISEASNAGNTNDVGHDYFADFEARMDEDARDTEETPWEVINDLMDGGLAPGELGVIIAPSGAGKSWMLQKLGAHAISRGKVVVHYTLELSEKYTGKRFDSIFSGVSPREVEEHRDRLKTILDDHAARGGGLKIKFYPSHTSSARTIYAHIQQLKAMGVKPDLIVVDYGDLLRPARRTSDSTYEEMGGVYEELRSVSGELGVPIWTASQTNRDAIDKEVIQANSVADSYKKVMTGDFVISISRRDKDKLANTGRFHLIKNRFGPDGMTLPAHIDTSCGKIEIFHPTSAGGVLAEKDAKNGNDIQRKLLAKKFNELS